MKKNNKKIIMIISIILILLVLTILVINIINDKKKSKVNMELIKHNYNELSTTVTEYNQIRTDLSHKLNNFIYEDYLKEHDSYIELLTKYNNNINSIDKNINIINDKCGVIYDDINVNKICDSYKVLYEKLINLYILDLTNYNNKITSYNEYKKDDIELFKIIHSEYIDYNNDNKYEGVDSENGPEE